MGISIEFIDPGKLSPQSWNPIIAALPGAHILQTWEWGQVKARFGWEPCPIIWRTEDGGIAAAALVLLRSLPVPGLGIRLRVAYTPKGPLCDWGNDVLRERILNDMENFAHGQKAIFVKIDPDVRLGCGIPSHPDERNDSVGQKVVEELRLKGWLFSSEQIQFKNTVLVDLRPDLETLMANMKQKTRYNVRLARRKGVNVRVGSRENIEALYEMYVETAARDGFVIRDEAYYQAVWSTFIEAGMAEALVAEVDGEMVAALMIFKFAGKAWYLYGMSRPVHREKMPNYLLQWEAIQHAKVSGCQYYDLWGAPDRFIEDDPLWGVFRFKKGLGGEVVRHVGAWDKPTHQLYYRLYTQVLPRVLDVMRWRGRRRNSQMIE